MYKRLWAARWPLVRLCLAASLLAVAVADNPTRLARLQYRSLPNLDYQAEVQKLRAEKRYAEALLIAEAGLEELTGDERAALSKARDAVLAERDSWLRRGSEFVRGVIIGDGTSVEALVGAVTADMFVVGDVRDLLIQGGRLAVDGDADKLVLALSAVGLMTTVLPEIDVVAALLKVAKKAGALSQRMAASLLHLFERVLKGSGDGRELRPVVRNLHVLMDKATPAGALRFLRQLDDPKDVERVAAFLERHPHGAVALHVAGKEGVEVVKRGAREAEETLVLAAKKGQHGMAWLRAGNAKLLRPHLLLGLAKGVYKGTLPRALERFLNEYVDPKGWLILPALAVWVLLEIYAVWRRLLPNAIAAHSTRSRLVEGTGAMVLQE